MIILKKRFERLEKFLILEIVFTLVATIIFGKDLKTIYSISEKDRAELNIEIVKIFSERIKGIHYPNQKKILFNIEGINQNLNMRSGLNHDIFITENLNEMRSYSVKRNMKIFNDILQNNKKLRSGGKITEKKLSYNLKGRNMINQMTADDNRNLEISYSGEIPEVYIGMIDRGTGDIVKVFKGVIEEAITTFSVATSGDLEFGNISTGQGGPHTASVDIVFSGADTSNTLVFQKSGNNIDNINLTDGANHSIPASLSLSLPVDNLNNGTRIYVLTGTLGELNSTTPSGKYSGYIYLDIYAP